MASSRRPTLLHAMEHHAKDKAELIYAISLVYSTMLAPNGWGIKNLRGGANSWMIYDEDDTSKQFHFRNGGKGRILVFNHYRRTQAKRVVLNTRLDVVRWAETVLA